MKFKKLLFIIFICFLSFINQVDAKSSYSCNKEVSVGSNIICNVIVENDTVMIESDGNISIDSINGKSYLKNNEYQVVFYESGSVSFGPAIDKYSKYIISLLTEDGKFSYADDTRISVIAKTTSSKTTTKKTTTTTKTKSSNNNLSSITIDGNLLKNFDENLLKYSITVPYETNNIDIKAKAADELSSIEITGPNELEIGDNVYTISVTSEDNTTKFYKIYINKEDEVSSDTSISEINIKGYKLKLNGNSKTYHLNIDENINELDIDIVTKSDKANYIINGNENLKNGSIIKIIVTAENNDTDTYRIIINKVKEKEKSIMPYIIIGTLILIIISIIIIIIINKKRKNKNKKNIDKEMEISNKENINETKTFDNFLNNEKIDEDICKTKEIILNEKNKD